MQAARKTEIALATTRELNLKKTFECGQCFRWNLLGDGSYVGVVGDKVLRIWERDETVLCDSNDADLPFWRRYFDMDMDYEAATSVFTQSDYLKACCEYGAGIRILRQEPWETLISFIISQLNSIPRIMQIINALCENFGRQLEVEHGNYYTFPDAQTLAHLTKADLSPLRCGYRADYIINAALFVTSGGIDLDAIYHMQADASSLALKQLRGVGDKVAHCVMLYGYHKMDAFPVDTWMKRALKAHFPPDFNPSDLGPHAGLAQQYIFYYSRENKDRSCTA